MFYLIYNKTTGVCRRLFEGPEPWLQLDANEDYAPTTERLDPDRYRVNLATNELVELAEITQDEEAVTRNERNALLIACDWAAMPDVPLSEAHKAEVLAYRQALRDMMATTPYVIPAKPEWL